MNKDKLTSLLGASLGALHQVGLVGIVPTTRADWINTGVSALMILLGVYTNKK